jgi:hypothetical protein
VIAIININFIHCESKIRVQCPLVAKGNESTGDLTICCPEYFINLKYFVGQILYESNLYRKTYSVFLTYVVIAQIEGHSHPHYYYNPGFPNIP